MTEIDSELGAIIDAFRTCEFTTLGKDGTPLTWPTSAKRQDDGTLLITTSLGFPQKAFNIRRDGRVALLFSDPTASGLTDAPQVFVAGTAVCPDEIVTSPAGLETYWAMLFDRQPSSRAYLNPPTRWLMDWYYQRLLITITPTEVEVRPALVTKEPENAPEDDVVARFDSAVAGATDASGAPVLWRTQPGFSADGYTLEAPEGVVSGPATLLVHSHDDKLAGLKFALVKGVLKEGDTGWVLIPERVIEPSGGGSPADLVRMLRTSRRTAKGYLQRRGLTKPAVQWEEFKAVAANAAELVASGK